LLKLGSSLIDVYTLGLIVYTFCSWVRHTKVKALEKWLSPLYDWALQPIRKVIKPLKLGTTHVDFTPMLLLFGILIIRRLWILLWLTPY
jgi:uncharacterized protein YggT (Ycf19 family)